MCSVTRLRNSVFLPILLRLLFLDRKVLLLQTREREREKKVSSNLLFAWLVWCFLCLRYMFFLATFLTSNCKHRVLSSLAFYVFSVNPSLIPFSLNVHHRHNIFLFLLSCPSISLEFPLFFVTLLLTHTKTTSPWSPNPQTERFHWHERIFLSLPD